MTNMYDEPRMEEDTLTPYPSESKSKAKFNSDPGGYILSVEQRARERQVAIETVRLLRRRVIECYRKEGVNHYENCKKPVQDYCEIIIKKDFGQLQPPNKNE
mmetsp:Transcript_12064/g.20457  ORF Transcript_12064/g.20457 Transcript_12064/m.20457 type:complete len:102 (-) Transcript_12064:223-528(-)|eukprot:CAMPEP_0116553310 /NCGR_PEP_ID=MMETSP0397-20121206/6986_1 /TAXON_ID=216820 /ORGANISM="Cyclophora tenuis, Strain ECT3854" /LENGTH=101 /DNA_ID=CAMNT_0004078387 /DNA_START=1003 /DNA_END=1308 /DNA_ORIENTATION=+